MTPIMSKKRLQILQDLLKKKSWDALLLEDPLSLLYLTGVSVSAGQLLISEKNALLIVDGRYIETAETKSACPVAFRSEEIVKSTLAKWDAQIIAISSQDTSYFAYINWVEALPEFHIEPARNPVHCLREIKDPEERVEIVNAGEYIIIPKNVEHCPCADEECEIILLEPKTTLNTGNVKNDAKTVEILGSVI